MKAQMIKTSLTEQVYDIIKEMILNGHLKAGERIDINKLAEEFHISQTPIRYALNRLHDAGLVENRPRVGFYVIELDEEEIAETYDLREMFETHALESAIANVKTAFWMDLKERMESIWDISQEEEKRARFDETDAEFHLAIIKGADNKKARELFLHIYDSIKISLAVGTKLDQSLRDHLEILAAIIEKDLSRAEQRLREHLHDSKQTVIEQFRYRNGQRQGVHGNNRK